jgi:hypothetical protein
MHLLPDPAADPRRGIDAARRGFIGLAVCAPVAATGVLLGGLLPTLPAQALPAAQPATAQTPHGYHLSEHVRCYYRSARY